MIELVPGMPEGVTGIRVSGKVTGDDFKAFRSAMDEVLAADEIRVVEIIESDYAGFGSGGLAEDLKMGLDALFHHHEAWKKIAVVSDKEWIAHALHAFAWLIPGEMKLFGPDQLEEAKSWAAS